ncbi:uncharacterized protein AC631_05284 [Debaryomyces fabryi]|uniref:Uncharacterized protein n=1 Tax=Debaryomyces fabryi TaxID=58627 RepID=A0A0V1PRV2_9ASCO|nr:uncharacterized protein AC631_05284 [Debaryomyces fabryi]KRZ98965.1 hypothetical protein AC631_05284 [Debaryomyces fabryi]
MPLGEPGARPNKSGREHDGEGHGRHYGYDWHYPPPPPHFYPPPPGAHMMGYPPGPPPFGPPPFFHHLGPPPGPPPGPLHYPHHNKSYWGDHSSSLAHMMEDLHPHHHPHRHPHKHPHRHPHGHPHHKKHHWHDNSMPPHMMGHPPPPRHRGNWNDYSTPPHMMGPHRPRSPSYRRDGDHKMKTGSPITPGSLIATGSSSNSKFDSNPSSRSGSISTYVPTHQHLAKDNEDRNPPFIIPRLGGSLVSGYSQSYHSSDAKNDSRLSESSRSTYEMCEGLNSPHARGVHGDQEGYEEPFSNYELMKYELPNWSSLNKLLDYYYKYNHSKHQLLSNKQELIKRISLNSDSSILHAIISTVCLLDDRFECETYWVERVFKYWDNLNDFGMLLSYSLISQNSLVKSDLSRLNDLNSKIWDLIKVNKFIDIVNEPKENLNSRQMYEKERLIRIIWNYWINHVVLVKFKQGFPRYQLSKEEENVKLNDEVYKYMSNLALPLSDKENLEMKGKRKNCEVLDTTDLSKDELADSHAVILATKKLDTTIKKISLGELTEESELNNDLNNYVNDKVLTINQNNTVLIINSSYLLASFITKTNDCLHSSFFISDLIFSGMSKTQSEVNKFIPLADEFSVRSMFNFDGLSKLIEELSTFQWNCLTNLITSISDIIKLIEIGSGVVPDEETKYLVIIGVTAMDRTDNCSWWDNSELVTDLNDSWYKYPDFALYSACSLLSMLVSLIVLTKFIKFKKDDSKLKIKLLNTSGERELELPTNHQFIDEFNDNIMLKKLSALINFIKFKLQANNYKTELISETMEKFDQINLYIEETLGAISN